jgi:thioredoxin 1
MLAPNFETVSEEINAASFFKLNTDELQKLAQKYNVMSIPTIIIYKKNNEIARLSGYMSVDDLKKKILKVIK